MRGLHRHGLAIALACHRFRTETDRKVPAAGIQQRRDRWSSRSGYSRPFQDRHIFRDDRHLGLHRRPLVRLNVLPDGRGTLHASTPHALDLPFRRSTKYFDKVRVRRPGNGTVSVGDASGDTMKTSITISIATSSGMGSGAATITPEPASARCRTCQRAFASARTQRTPAHARAHHAAPHFIGMRVCVPLTLDCRPKRVP